MPLKTYVLTEVLDYVGTHASGESTFGVSQRELSRALGYHPSSMSRPLDRLVREGFLTGRRGLVRGGLRKQLVYQLTPDGRDRLARRTRDVPMLAADLPVPPRPFFGRRAELRQLAEFSTDLDAVISVEGGPGMGKTALVAQYLRRIKRGRVPFWFTVRAGSSPHHFLEAIAHALSPIGAAQLAYYAQVPRPPTGKEVASLTIRSLGASSLLGVIDDVHVSGPDMRKFLEDFLATIVADRKGLIFLIGQESLFLAPSSPPARRLVIGGLDRVAAHGLTDRQGGLADRFEPIFQSSLGSPLLLQLAVQTPGVVAEVSALPEAVVARMPPAEMRDLLMVAVANEPLPSTFLTESGGLSESRIKELAQVGILHPAREGRVELLDAIRKPLITRAGPAEVEAHQRLALFYARSHRSESVRERFLHLVAAETWRGASDLLVQGERKILSLGYSDALRQALNHMVLAMPAGTGRIRALRVESELLRMHSEYPEAILALRRAIADARDDPRVVAECLLLISELHVRMRQVEEARSVLDQARELGAPTKRLKVLVELSEARVVEAMGDLPRAQDMFRSTFELGRKSRIADLALESLAAWSRLSSLGGDQEEALRIVEAGLPEARLSGRMDLVFNLLLVRSRAYAETGRKDLAEIEMRIIRSEAEALGHLNQLAYTLSGLAAMAMEGSRWEEAIDFARQAVSLSERLGNEIVLGHTLAILAAGELRREQFVDAEKHGERSVQVLSRLPPSDSLVVAHTYLTEVYAAIGKGPQAREQYDLAVRLATAMGMTWWKERMETEVKEKIDALPRE